MNELELRHLVKQATEDLEIDQPIYHAQVAGNVLRLHLPSTIVEWQIPGRKPDPPPMSPKKILVINNPSMYDREALREIAAELGIIPQERDWKVDLVKAINQWKKETGWTPEKH